MSNTTDVVLGIDGGATGTRAWIVRLDGTVLARGAAGGSNVFDLGVDVSRRVIVEATREAWHASGLPGDKACGFLAVFAGIAGAGANEEQRALATALAADFGVAPANTAVDHDLRVAHAGALVGEPGVIILAGTGSAAYGRAADGRSAKAGGWGPVLDDGGSGHWLGVQAMRLVIRVADGREAATPLAEAVLAQLEASSPRDMLNRLQSSHPRHLRRADIAALAPIVLVAADTGEATAGNILDRGAEELADKAAAVLRRLGAADDATLPVAAAGGLLENNESYFDRVAAALVRRVPGARLGAPRLSPVAGAVWLALALAGGRLSAEVQRRLRRA
jgi:N-acetylglucosamine kinase-like BadF-type ATPase